MQRRYRILIVDDEAEHNANIKDILEMNGYAVNTAINGKEAISFCQKDSYDLALVDIKLPDISGNTVVSEMSKISPSTEYIYITGYASIDSAIEAAKQEHVVSYETKPINMDRLLPIIKQITERKQAEEKLRKSEEHYHALAKLSPVGMFHTDSEGHCLYVNERWCEITGLAMEEAKGEGWARALHPDDRDRIFTKWYQAAKSKSIFKSEYRFLQPDGTITWVFGQALPEIVDNGDLVGYVGTMTDITERKRMEEVLQFTQFAIDNNADATYWVKSDAKISYANKAACQSLGYSYEELTCMRVHDIDPDFPDESWPAHWQEMKEAGTLTFEGHHKTKAGLVFPVEIQSTYLEYEGQEYICAFVRNITERKKMDEMILQTEKLRAMGMMTSGVAHDFNNILAVISGNAQLMGEKYGDHKEMMDGFRIIRKAVNDGAEIVRRMKKFTKVERDASEFMSVDIKKILEQAIEFSRPRWMNIAKAGEITYNIDKTGIKKIPDVLGNPPELREVFVNIINNALDAMTGGGCISFCTWSKDDTVFVSISDTGEGMTEEVRKRIFDPFFTTKRSEGSGLGMSVTYGVITGHGGKIEVESEVGKGATFTLSIPITRETPQLAVSPDPPRKIKAHGLRILVIDDEEEICSVLNKYFSRDGHEVRSVNNGTEAIKLLKNEDFGLILCDLVLPDMSGHDIVKVLDALDKKPKVGLITGWDEKIETKSKEELKIDFIIRKPFDFSTLTSHINEAFNTG
ncbi:MAG: response regulator [Candidatus Scalinduaceae bacterium]